MFQGLVKAQQLSTTPEMSQLVRLAAVRRQREVVNPILFECAMNGDAQKLFCTLEEGDCVNAMVSDCTAKNTIGVLIHFIHLLKLNFLTHK